MSTLTRKGKYMVREDIEKAPTHDHPCNLTRCQRIIRNGKFENIRKPEIGITSINSITSTNTYTGTITITSTISPGVRTFSRN